MKNEVFCKVEDTADSSKSVSVHTEVRWYGDSGKLEWRSDIVIIDIHSLRVKNGIFNLPSKSFAFNKPKAIIEIKLRRINGASDNTFISKIKEDVNKLKAIKRKVYGNYYCGVVVLDKKKNIIYRAFRNNREIKIHYKYTRQGNIQNLQNVNDARRNKNT